MAMTSYPGLELYYPKEHQKLIYVSIQAPVSMKNCRYRFENNFIHTRHGTHTLKLPMPVIFVLEYANLTMGVHEAIDYKGYKVTCFTTGNEVAKSKVSPEKAVEACCVLFRQKEITEDKYFQVVMHSASKWNDFGIVPLDTLRVLKIV